MPVRFTPTTQDLLRRSIWWKFWDNFFQFSIRIYVPGTHWKFLANRTVYIGLVNEYLVIILGWFSKCFDEALLLSTHNICFYGQIRKIIPDLSSKTCPLQRSAWVVEWLVLLTLIMKSWVWIPLDVKFSSWLYGGSLHKAFYCPPFIVSMWLK